MAKKDKLTPNELALTAKRLGDAIKGTPFQDHVFIVGGAVRDYYLKTDIKDIDIAVELPNGGIAFGEYISKKMGSPHAIVTYPKYGTCKFTIDIKDVGEVDFEAVQCRKEWYTEGSRKPSKIAVGNMREDAHRRDLTINALYLDVSTMSVFDPTTKGYGDLKNHILSCPTDAEKTFKDDPLRMLRVIRFKTKLGWDVDKNTWMGIIENAHEIENVSKERINDELTKILLCDKPSEGIRALLRCNLLGYVLPDIYNMVGITQGFQHFGDVFEHTMKVLDNTKKDIVCRLGGLFHDVGKIMTRTENNGLIHFYSHESVGGRMVEIILKDLKYPNQIISNVASIVRYHMSLCDLNDSQLPSDKRIRKFMNLTNSYMDSILDVIDADCHSFSEKFCKPNFVTNLRKRIAELKEKEKDYSKKLTLPINGSDIMKEFKIKPSPIIGKLLEKVKEAYLDNPIITKDECFELVEAELKKAL